MRSSPDIDWNCLQEFICTELACAHEDPDEPYSLAAEAQARGMTLFELLAAEIIEKVRMLILQQSQSQGSRRSDRNLEIDSQYRRVEFHWLDAEVCALKAELELATRILTERRQIRERIRLMKMDELARYVLTKAPEWEFAQQTLDMLRKKGADRGHKHIETPAKNACVPHDPAGTEGDHWRIKGG